MATSADTTMDAGQLKADGGAFEDKLEPTPELPSSEHRQPKGIRFWLVLTAILIALFLSLLEAYAVSTILPVIINDLQATQFIWVPTTYGIASTALLPLSGGFAEIFGRRPVMLASVSVFAVGSAVSGAANNMNVLLVGRSLQGAGAGGIISLTQIILSDLVTLEERGKYTGLTGLMWAVSAGIGPVIGGALARHIVWRWLFYLNLPLAGISFVLIVCFLKVPTPQGTLRDKLKKIDFIGNILVIGATCACAIALTFGGVVYPWSSARVLAPLCLSAVMFAILLFYENYFASHPVIPLSLMSNRTSFSGYVQMAMSAFINVNLIYYLPVYYQACKDASPIGSGVDIFGIAFSTAPFSILAGISISVTKRYRPQIWFGWAMTILSVGLLSTLTEDSSRGKSIGFQAIAGTGIGIMFSASYFPVLAPLPVTANAHALSYFVFLRNFSQVLGVTIGGAILQNELQNRLPPSLLSTDSTSGGSIAYAIIPLIRELAPDKKNAVRHAFAHALVVVWRMLIAVGAVGLVASVFMKPVALHAVKDENWALEERKKDAETWVVNREDEVEGRH